MNTSRSPLSNNGIQNIQTETTPDSVANSVPLQEGGSYVSRPNEGVIIKFDYNSMRAKQARLANVVGSNAVSLLGWGLSLVGFTVLAYIGPIMGETFLAAIGLLPWAIWWPIHIYYEYYLKDLKVKPQGQEPELRIDHILDQQVLARLNQNPSPQDIALSLKSTPASNYFGWRFGLANQFYANLSSDHPEDDGRTWINAVNLMKSNQDTTLRPEHLIAALIMQIPNADQYLAQLNLESDDILSGVNLFRHRREVLNNASRKRNVGGIGRDLSFGYTPTLDNFAHNITNEIFRGAYVHRKLESHQDILSQVAHIMTTGGTRSVALVGRSGVGKSTLVWGLGDLLISDQSPPELKFHQVFSIDTAALISKIKASQGQAESILTALFIEASHAKNIILAFENSEKLFYDEGAGTYNLSNILIDLISKGAVPVIVTVSDNAWVKLLQTNPSVSSAMQALQLKPQTQEDTMLTLEDQTLILENKYSVVYTYQALKKSIEIGDRFVRDKALPGSAIEILEAASSKAESKLVTRASVEISAEEMFGVKVQSVNTKSERQTLLNLEQLIHQGMVNQSHAVKAVADALRQSRAGVKTKTRSMGAFLFLGPTGVGKTELAKQLAKVYFGGEDNIIRFNLNEYTQGSDVARLLQSPSDNPLSLTAQIFKKPFSVVLFDEVEKAHPQVLDLFLQLLDEGILTDNDGKTVSFSDAIIIATSNAGSQNIYDLISSGIRVEDLPAYEKNIIDDLIRKGLFRPEFINRFDESIVFRPLNKQELGFVAKLIISDLANNLKINQKLNLSVGSEVISLLVEKGYDPQMGARPMRRIISKTIENIVANRILSGEVAAGGSISVDLRSVETVLGE
ncbi:MAG: AAA family ATPase [Candidatus Saccharimonadales bacterium]